MHCIELHNMLLKKPSFPPSWFSNVPNIFFLLFFKTHFRCLCHSAIHPHVHIISPSFETARPLFTITTILEQIATQLSRTHVLWTTMIATVMSISVYSTQNCFLEKELTQQIYRSVNEYHEIALQFYFPFYSTLFLSNYLKTDIW